MSTLLLSRRVARLEELAVPSAAGVEAVVVGLVPAAMGACRALAAGSVPEDGEEAALSALLAAVSGVSEEESGRLLRPVMAQLDLEELRRLASPPGGDDHDERIVCEGNDDE